MILQIDKIQLDVYMLLEIQEMYLLRLKNHYQLK